MTVTSIRLKFVSSDVDRHGNVRFYFRRKGQQKIRLNGMPGSESFMAAYQAALSSENVENKKYKTAVQGSFGETALKFYASADFKLLDARSTQPQYKKLIDDICEVHGHKKISTLESHRVQKFLDAKSETPGQSLMLLKALRALFRFAKDKKLVQVNPTHDVKAPRYKSKPHHTWTLEEVEQFEKCHPVGTKARLALNLLLYTCCRRGDVVDLGPQHIKDGRLRYTQDKNRNRSPVKLDIPVHPLLMEIIAATPSQHLTFHSNRIWKGV